MKKEYKEFATLFNSYRFKANFETLVNFGDALAHEGFVLEESTFSRWKNGHRIPHKRAVALAIIKVFLKAKAITTREEANELLTTTQHYPLSQKEFDQLNHSQTEFTYHSLWHNLPLTEEDALYIAQKILGKPFLLLHEEQIIKIYYNTKHSPHQYIQILKQLEIKPTTINTYTPPIKSGSTINDGFSKDFINTSIHFAYIKKHMSGNFHDKFMHH